MATNYLITGFHGTPHLTAENDRYLYASIFGNDRYVLSAGNAFRYEIKGTHKLRVYDGILVDGGALAGIPAGQYLDFDFPEVGSGRTRIDLVVFEYNRNVDTQIETGEFKIISGTETSGTPTIPTPIQSNILNGTATRDQMPLFQVTVTGLEGIKVIMTYARHRDIRTESNQMALSQTLTAKKEVIAEAGTMDRNAAIEAAKMVNLIPNGDFRHPVGHAGGTSIKGPGEGFSGWMLPEGVEMGLVTISPNFVSLRNLTTENKIVYTMLPKGSLVAGQQYTAAFRTINEEDAPRVTGTAEIRAGSEYTQFIAPSTNRFGMVARIGTDYDEIGIVIPAGYVSGMYCCFFTEGDLTSYAPLQDPDYYPRRDKSVDAMLRNVMELQPMLGMQPRLMWTNPDPLVEFVASSVNMDLTGYTHVLIEAQSESAAGVAYTEHFLISAPAEGGTDPKRGCLGAFNCTGWRRIVNVYTDHVNFGNASFCYVTPEATTQEATDDLKLVPYRIYGIRRMYV